MERIGSFFCNYYDINAGENKKMTIKLNPFKSGDKVYFKNDETKQVFIVHTIYTPQLLSLGLKDYPDTEQDYLVNVHHIVRISERGLQKKKK